MSDSPQRIVHLAPSDGNWFFREVGAPPSREVQRVAAWATLANGLTVGMISRGSRLSSRQPACLEPADPGAAGEYVHWSDLPEDIRSRLRA